MYRQIFGISRNITLLLRQNSSLLHTTIGNAVRGGGNSILRPTVLVTDSNNSEDTKVNNKYQTNDKNKNDIKDVKDIEASLFEQSAHKSQPVNTRELMEQYKEKPFKKKLFKKIQPITSSENVISVESNSPSRAIKVKSNIITTSPLGIPYTKLHLNDPWLNNLLMNVKSKKMRSRKHQLLIEGRRLISEAITSGLHMEYLLFSDISEVILVKEHLLSIEPVPHLVKVPQTDLKFWSNLSTCPGLMAIFTKPDDMEYIWRRKSTTLPITVICDQIREPNNVGSIIRNCASISCERVLFTKGCADPWESKALRGGCGAQFHIPIFGPMEWSSVPSFLPKNDEYYVYLAENNVEHAKKMLEETQTYKQQFDDMILPYSKISYRRDRHYCIVIGGETHGISEDAYRLLDKMVLGNCIQIPLAEDMDSLNTASALAVILFEMKKQMLD